MRFLKFFCALVLFTFLNGCAMAPFQRDPNVPESLGEKGLVIAEVAIVGVVLPYPSEKNIYIDGRKKGKLIRGYFAVVLPVGEHTLDSLYVETSLGRAGGVSYMKSVNLPIRRKFSIRSGEVTNLGQLLLTSDHTMAKEKRFNTYAVDNTEDMKYFLKAHYPNFYEKLRPNALRLESGTYVKGSDLQKLRQIIASVRINNYKAVCNKLPHHVLGPAGTIAILKQHQGRSPGFDFIPSPVMTDILSSSEPDRIDRFAFLANDQRFFIYHSGHINQRTLPVKDVSPSIYIAGDKDIILAYHKFHLYISNDDGQTWHPFDAAAVKNDKYGRSRFADDIDGYYIIHSYPPRLLYATHGSSDLKNVPIPLDADNIRQFTPCRSELFLEKNITAWTSKTPFPFYVRSRTGRDWETRYMPRAECNPIHFIDGSGKNMRTICEQDVFLSDDGGRSWHLR